MKRIAVVGLGRLGMELAGQLAASGVEVIAIDTDRSLVEKAQERVALAVRLDATDAEALTAQGIPGVDLAMVAIGEGFEATLLTVLALKQVGVKHVIARAQNPTRAQILQKVGADETILPELATARRLAQRLVAPQLEDAIELSPDHSLVQLKAPERFCHRTLAKLKLRQKYGVNVVALKRQVSVSARGAKAPVSRQIISVPGPESVIQPTDILVIIGPNDMLSQLPTE